MKILYLSTVYYPAVGGAQNHFHAMVKKLASENDVSVISQVASHRIDRWVLDTTLFAPLRSKKYKAEGIDVQQVNLSLGQRLRYWPFIVPYYLTQKLSVDILSDLFLKKICKSVDVSGVDLVHCVKIGREFLPGAGLKLARKLNVPFVFTPCHHPKWEGVLYRSYQDICRQADVLIALTQAEKDNFIIRMGVDSKKVHVVNVCPLLPEESPGIDFRRKYNISGKYVLFLGIKHRYKGIELFLDSSRFVWEKYPDMKFLVVGPQTSFSDRYFKKWRNEPRIIELPAINDEEKVAALRDCSLLCLPSYQESFGGVFLEAWSMGKPVVGGRIPAVADVIEDGRDGYLAEHNPKDVAEKIIAVLDNPAKAEEMGRRGRMKVQEKYNLDKMVDLTKSVYTGIISEVGKPKVERKAKVLLASPLSPPYSGYEKITEYILKSGISKDFTIIHLDTSAKRACFARGRLDLLNSLIFLRLMKNILGQLTKYRPLIAYIPIARNKAGFLKWSIFILLSSLYKVSVVSRLGGADFDKFYQLSSGITKRYIKFVLSRVKILIVEAERLKDQFKGLFPQEKLRVIYNPVDSQEIYVDRKDKPSNAQTNILYMSLISKAKGALDLLEAVPFIVKDNPHVKFLFAGDKIKVERNIIHIDNPLNMEKEIQRIIAKNDIKSYVEFVGMVTGQEKRSILSNSDIFVFPSYSEGFPLVVLEAMAAGIPIVATAVGALPEVLTDGVNVHFTKVGDPQDLSRKITVLMNDESLRNRMVQANRKILAEKFSLDIFGRKTADIFKDIVAEKGCHKDIERR